MDFRSRIVIHRFLLSATHIRFLNSEAAILSQNRTVRSDSGPVCLTGRLSGHQREFRRRGTQCTKTLWPLVWEGTVCYWDGTLHCWMSRELHTHTEQIRTSTCAQNMNDVSPAWVYDIRVTGWLTVTKPCGILWVSSFLRWLIIKIPCAKKSGRESFLTYLCRGHVFCHQHEKNEKNTDW